MIRSYMIPRGSACRQEDNLTFNQIKSIVFLLYRTKVHAQHRRAASSTRSDTMLLCSKREDAALALSALRGKCRLIVWNDQRNKQHILAVSKASPERISGALHPPFRPMLPLLPSLLPLCFLSRRPHCRAGKARKGGCRRGAEVIVVVRGGVRSLREAVERSRDEVSCAIAHWCDSARAGGPNVVGPHGNALERRPNKPTFRS